MVKVKVPTPFLKLTDNKPVVEVEGGNIADVIEALEKTYPGMKKRICTGDEVNRFINIYVDGEDIRFAQGVDTQLKQDSEVSIVPAISGG